MAYYIGNSEHLAFDIFIKILFDIAHTWCPNVDCFEYVAFLQAVYKRIISVWIHKDESVVECPVDLILKFPEVDGKIDQQLQGSEAEWQECGIDEPEDNDNWEYTFKETTSATNKYQKLKRPKVASKRPAQKGINAGFVIEEEWSPVIPKEEFSSLKIEYKLAELDKVFPFGYFGELYIVQLANKQEDKESASALMTEELIIKNAVKHGKTNGKIKEQIEGFKYPNANAEIGYITSLVLLHGIKAGKEHKISVSIPILENITKILRDYGDIVQGLDLHLKYSIGLQRKIILEQLKLNVNLEWVNINYSVERGDVKRAMESSISLRGNRDNLVLLAEEGEKEKSKYDGSKDGDYLNDISFAQFMQILLSSKQIAIKSAMKNYKKEEGKKEEIVKHEINNMSDTLYKLKTKKGIISDAWTSEQAVVEYAKQEVCYY